MDLCGAFCRHLAGPGLSLGPHGSFLVTGLNLSNFLIEYSSISGTILAPNFSKSEKVMNKQCPKNGVKKNGSQSTSKAAKCVIRTVNTICFERSYIREFDGLGCPFGSLLGSLFHIVCKKCDPRPQKTGTQKTHQTIVETSHAVKISRGA